MITLYTKYKHIIYEFKSKDYLAWAKQKHPHLDLHHTLSKKIDYLIKPVEHSLHLGEVHSKKAHYFELWLKESVDLFILYVNERFFEKFNQKLILPDYEPETLKAIFTKVKEWENEH